MPRFLSLYCVGFDVIQFFDAVNIDDILGCSNLSHKMINDCRPAIIFVIIRIFISKTSASLSVLGPKYSKSFIMLA